MFQSDYYIVDVPSSSTEKLEANINTTRPASVDIQLALYNIFIPLIGILIIIFNLAIVISSGLILHRGQQPRSTYIFLGNVALSDLLIGITILFGQFLPPHLRNETICCLTIGFIVSSAMSSVYSVGLIAIDRYLYILYGLQYQRYISSNRARIMSLMTWLIGLIIGFLPLMGIRNFTNNGKLCWFIILVPPELIFITCAIGIIPLITIIILYSIILKHALNRITELKSAGNNEYGIQIGTLRLFRGGRGGKKFKNSIQNDETTNESYVDETLETTTPNNGSFKSNRFSRIFRRNQGQNKLPKSQSVYNPSKWKAIKIVLYTTGSFFITWFPFFVASTLFALCDPKKTPRYCDNLRIAMASPLTILGLINSLLNPIIYAWWHNGFRESIKKIYHGIFTERFHSESTSSTTAKTINRISLRGGGGGGGGVSGDDVGSGGVTSGSELETSDIEQRIVRPSRPRTRSNRPNEQQHRQQELRNEIRTNGIENT